MVARQIPSHSCLLLCGSADPWPVVALSSLLSAFLRDGCELAGPPVANDLLVVLMANDVHESYELVFLLI